MRRILGKLRYTFFPTAHQRMVKKWYRDDPDEGRRLNYALEPSSLVLDLGGHKGQWSSDVYSMYRCRIIVFEPISEFADVIKNRFRHNASIDVRSFGLAGVTRTQTMGVCGDASSIFKTSKRTETVRLVDIAELIHGERIDRIDLLKVNIEGGEYELIERLIETELIGIVRDLQVQFHQISRGSARRMEEIWDRLSVTHHPTYRYRFVWENWTRNEGCPKLAKSSAHG